MDRKLQRHRADSLRQHGFLVMSAMIKWLFEEGLMSPVNAAQTTV